MDPKETNWYVLYTFPRAEKQVKERLEREGIDCWLPLHRSPRVWSDRVKLVDVPLFKSYIFVHCTEVVLRSLIRIYGVVRIVYYNGKPAIVRDQEIEAIKDFLKEAEAHPLCFGEEVEILCGAMKGVTGKIVQINKSHLVLTLEQLAATVCVKLETVTRTTRI